MITNARVWSGGVTNHRCFQGTTATGPDTRTTLLVLDRRVVTGPRVCCFGLDAWSRLSDTTAPPLRDRGPEEEAKCESGREPDPKQ